MSTPINQLNTNTNNDKKMDQDDSNSNLVSEILQEMNNNDNTTTNDTDNIGYQDIDDNNNSQRMYLESQKQRLDRQFDSNVNLPAKDNLNYNFNDDYPLQNDNDINTYSNQNITMKTSMLQTLKDPGIVILSTLLINNMFSQNLFQKIINPILAKTGYRQNIFTNLSSSLIQAIVVGFIFFGIKKLI